MFLLYYQSRGDIAVVQKQRRKLYQPFESLANRFSNPGILPIMQAHSIYIHIPFCKHRCNYCDFNTYAGLENLIPAYTQALLTEIELLANPQLPIGSVFLGGGTPSLLPVSAVEHILQKLAASFHLLEQIEVTLEANPGTLSFDYLHALRRAGINRLSLGMQSAHPEELAFLERGHDYGDVVQAVSAARRAGFGNLSLDLIFGLPEQQTQAWAESLKLALGLAPEHLSLYALTLEHGTPLGSWAARGLIPVPDPDIAAEMYELAADILASAEFVQYEISNWARDLHVTSGKSQIEKDKLKTQFSTNLQSYACQHNLQYWRNQPYLGLGAGAHGYANGLRTVNVLSPKAYIQRLQPPTSNRQPPTAFPRTPATVEANAVDRDTEMRETLMMGLRLTREGVSGERFRERFGEDLSVVFEMEMTELVKVGLLEWGNDRLRLTRRGRLLGNQVFIRFVE